MSDVFDKYGDPNTWVVEDDLGYIYDGNENQLLYDMAFEIGFMSWVFEAIKERYNRERG